MPGRRPVLPIRWRNEATVDGASIWITRSRSPTSIPSSSVLVATITQSRSSANAVSAACAPRAQRGVRNEGLDVPLPERSGQRFDLRAAVAEDEPLLAAIEPRYDRRGVLERPDVVDRPARRPSVAPSRRSLPRRAPPRTTPAAPRGCRPSPRARAAGAGSPCSARSGSRPLAGASRGRRRRTHAARPRPRHVPAERTAFVAPAGDQHDFERLRRRQQESGGSCRIDPLRHSTTSPCQRPTAVPPDRRSARAATPGCSAAP